MDSAHPKFVKRAAIAIALAYLAFLLWYLRDFVLICIGALLIALLLDLVSDPFVRWCRLPRGAALALSGLLLLLAIGGAGFLFGTHLNSELQDVFHRADSAASGITDELHRTQLGRLLLSHLDGASFSLTYMASNVVQLSARFMEAVLFTVAAGVYLAVQPELYRKGAELLFPPSSRQLASETIDDLGRALRLWLLGQGIQMLLVGALSTFAVWLIGLPSPLALGAMAGVAEFVPYLGPIIASIPAILVAVTSGPSAVLWTIIAYVIIHQIEGNVIVPIIQRRMVFVPPAVLLLSIVAISFIFGEVAIIFAAPITVMAFIAVKRLYVRETLGEPTSLPGETTS
ncbi:AI-2E family transporter [Bradyrhizobium sp.]|uniref:AI-2E family transporter n=1 Tax=Bradyrhizobium sp. TaxID=376 RepID=UPI003C59D7A8